MDRVARRVLTCISIDTGMLAEKKDFAGLVRINRELAGKAQAVDSPQRLVKRARRLPEKKFPKTAIRRSEVGGLW